MTGKMPPALSKALVAIRNWAIFHGWLVPSAEILGKELEIKPENAKARISRLERDLSYGYLKKRGRLRLLDEERVVTEELTAQIFVLLLKVCQEQGIPLVNKNTFAKYAAARLSGFREEEITEKAVLRLIDQGAIREEIEYIAPSFRREDFIRPGPRALYEEDYLRCIAKMDGIPSVPFEEGKNSKNDG